MSHEATRTDQATAPPALRVVSGNPTAEELAAVVAIFAASVGAEQGEEFTTEPAPWSAPSSMHRPAMPAPGPGVWAQLGRFR
jgi:hypothetical protein